VPASTKSGASVDFERFDIRTASALSSALVGSAAALVADSAAFVDGLFGMLKVNMKNKDIITPSDLEAAIRDTFKHHSLPVSPPLSLYFVQS